MITTKKSYWKKVLKQNRISEELVQDFKESVKLVKIEKYETNKRNF